MNHPSFDAPSLETMNQLLPAFEFLSLVAENELGAVYFAKQRSLDRDVAVKVLPPHVSADPSFRTSFETTARNMAKLNHPNLIGVYDSGFVNQMLYFLLEFVPGKSLQHSSHGQSIELSQTLRLINGICDGLAHAHRHGIVHGTLDPASILLNKKAAPKIGNFGLALSNNPSDPTPRESPFTAPEVLADPSAADVRSDIYSIGAILYGLATGRNHGPDAPAPSTTSSCGQDLDAVWKKATHPDPAKRFSTVADFQNALKEQTSGPNAQRPAVVPLAGKPNASNTPSPNPATARHTPPRQTRVGPNWKLIRNLFIIAGLLFAIAIAWDMRKDARAKSEREKDQIIAEEKARKEKAAALRERARAKLVTPPPLDPGSNTSPPDIIEETPRESLERLRHALQSGHRNEMPIGCTRTGENDYMLISEAMSWPEAARFAEEHGGHLAIPNIPANVTWLSNQVPGDEELWLGAGRNGRKAWTLADGNAWNPKKEPSGTGQYLAVNKHGLLRSVRSNERHPFLIQWQRDGKNPGTLDACLETTRKSLEANAPVYPPGTFAVDGRHYCFVSRPITWHDASEMAKQSGGHLAVASETVEIAYLEELAKKFNAPDGIWLGGIRNNQQWLWITGEPWKKANWADDSASISEDSALIIIPGNKWHSLRQSDLSSGFIIEWSKDSESKAAAGNAEPPKFKGEVSALAERAKELLKKLDEKRHKQLAENAKNFSWNLDIFVRDQTNAGKQIWLPHVDKLKNSVKSNRVPSSVPRSSGVRLSDRMAKTAKDCARKQDEIDAQFLSAAEKIRSAFSSKIATLRTQAQQAGQRDLAQELSKNLEAAENLKDWIQSLGINPTPENPKLKPKRRSSSSRYNSRSRRDDNGGGTIIVE